MASIAVKVPSAKDQDTLGKLLGQQQVTSVAAPLTRSSNSAATLGASPDVLVHGCKAFLDTTEGPVCIPNPDLKMSFWIGGHACRDIQLSADGSLLSVETYDIGGGCRLAIDKSISQTSTRLALGSRQSGDGLWTLKLDCSQPKLFEKKIQILDRADADVYAAVADLQQGSLQDKAEKRIDNSFTGALAYTRLGEIELAIKEYRKVIEYANSSGYRSIASEATLNLAHLLRANGLLAESSDMIAQAEAFLPAYYARGKILWHYHNGLVLREQMHLADAAKHLADASTYAKQMDDRASLAGITPVLADVLVTLDRIADAETLLANYDILLDSVSDCRKADILASKAWTSLQLAADERLPGTSMYVNGQQIKDMFENALQSRLRCVDNPKLANIQNGLARTAFYEGRFADSKSLIDTARKVKGLSAVVDLDLTDLEGRLAVAAGRADDALLLFKKLGDLAKARQAFQRDSQCRAAVGVLEALHLKKQTDGITLDLARTCIQTKSDDVAPVDARRFAYRLRAAEVSQ